MCTLSFLSCCKQASCGYRFQVSFAQDPIASAIMADSKFDNWAYLAAGVALGFGLSRLTRTHSAVPAKRAPKRCAGMCKLKKEMYDQYTQLHDHVRGCARLAQQPNPASFAAFCPEPLLTRPWIPYQSIALLLHQSLCSYLAPPGNAPRARTADLLFFSPFR